MASPFSKKVSSAKAKRFAAKSLNVLIIFVILACLVYSLVLNQQPKIIASSSSYHSTSTYQSAAAKQFAPLKNHTKLTVDEQAIVQNIKKQFPEVTVASVGLPLLGQKPTVRLNISAPSFSLNVGSQRYIVDKAGVAVDLATKLPLLKNLPVVDDQSGFNVRVGNQVLSTSSVAFITQLVAQSKLSKVPISSITLPPLAQELDVRTSDKPYYTKFYLGGDPSIQIGQFLAARHQFDATHQDPADYLDVRVSGKIYFK